MSTLDTQTPASALIISDASAGLYGFCNLCAVVTVLAFDILDTFNNEITYIWKRRIGVTGLFYVVARYVPFVINVVILILTPDINAMLSNNSVSKNLNLLYCIPWFIVLGCTEYLFVIRAVALNGNPRWLYYTLFALFWGEMVTAFAFYILSVPEFNDQVITTQSWFGTISIMSVPSSTIISLREPSVIAFGAPELAFQSMLVLVILCTIVRNRKTWMMREQCSLTIIVIRDGLWGYFLNLFGLLAIIVHPIWFTGPAGQPSIQWSYVTFSITSTRLLLNLRSSAGDPEIPSNIIPSFLSFNRPETNEETN